jgi:hypothetical protein
MLALIVHGTSNRVFEDIIQLHDYLCQFAEVTCTAVGTSCIKPLYDLGLEGRIEFFKHETVSDAILSLSERCEAIICYNESKNMESSNRFKSFLRTRIGAVRCPVLYIDNFNASYLTEFQRAQPCETGSRCLLPQRGPPYEGSTWCSGWGEHMDQWERCRNRGTTAS